MCGIAGFIQKTEASVQVIKNDLQHMLDRISHRGPDGSGEWYTENEGWSVALGHRRLSIIDVQSGTQPMSGESGRTHITYNGEVYNFHELRAALEQQGHHFKTASDTEVVLHQFEQKKAAGLSELNGMFAFATWDENSGELWLVRDRAGVKPLYYAATADGGVVFASELTALLEYSKAPRNLSVEGVASYFFSDYAQAPRTFIDGVKKLEPGRYVVWKKGRLSTPISYWSLNQVKISRLRLSADVLAEELWSRLRKAVKRQLVADVPVGVFLSGGIDSSIIAALAQSHLTYPVQTFSIGFEDAEYDESSYARTVARHIKSNHTEEVLKQDELLDVLDDAFAKLDEPMADPSLIPTFLLARLASRHVKVALGGDGGDEIWAGYPTYRAHRYASYYQAIPKLLRTNLIDRFASSLAVDDGYQSFAWKLKRFALRWDDDPIERHLRWMSNIDRTDLSRAVTDANELPEDWNQPPRSYSKDLINNMLALDFSSYLPGSVLTKVDRAAMAHGLEVRPPFLDNEIIEWAYSLPSHLKLHAGLDGFTSKYLLKKAADSRLPAEIVNRKKKGFAIPLSKWIKGPLHGRLDRVFQSSPFWDLNVLDRSTFQTWFSEHLEGRADHSKPLWALLVADHWAKRQKLDGIR